MKLVPRHSQIIGRMVLRRKYTSIIRPDETGNVTKFVLVDAVGSDAEAAGIKVGDIVVPTAISNIMLDGGFRPVLEEKNAGFFVRDVSREELLIQVESGAEYVPLDSPKAAQSLGEQESPQKTEAA